MIDAVEWNPKHHGHKPHYWKPDMAASLDNKNFINQEAGQDWAWIAGSTYYVPYEAVYGVRREVVEEEVGPVDPLVEALTKAGWGMPETNAKELRAALGAVGFKIVEDV